MKRVKKSIDRMFQEISAMRNLAFAVLGIRKDDPDLKALTKEEKQEMARRAIKRYRQGKIKL